MAYDAATGTAVLFGGVNLHGFLSDTWTWDGTTWTQQHPAVHPFARSEASMAYDATTGTVVLFGGFNNTVPNRITLGDTWTWDGTTWTKQHPAVHPSPRDEASMAYDAATGTVVLFGGFNGDRVFGGTWTWDGTTWTRQAPAASPPARHDASMAYDAATGTVVLFSGLDRKNNYIDDTWTWDGTTWTQQAPATSPLERAQGAMAYDAATSTAVLFGGDGPGLTGDLADTWTWDGTTWTQQAPATSPLARDSAAMAYDTASSSVVLFGGENTNLKGFVLSDSWTWG
jgi:hypothetical protein